MSLQTHKNSRRGCEVEGMRAKEAAERITTMVVGGGGGAREDLVLEEGEGVEVGLHLAGFSQRT
eukprot:199570-Rhodomonas_salina.3